MRRRMNPIVSWLWETVCQASGIFLIMIGALGGIGICSLPFCFGWSIPTAIITVFVGVVVGYAVCKIGVGFLDDLF